MDAQTIALCTGARMDRAQRYAEAVTAAMDAYAINTPIRQAMFLANIGHESGGLHYSTELWGPTEAQRRYEGRKDLGNTQPGDGFRYRGHGLIQTTGRFNHAIVRDRLRKRLGADVPDFELEPEALGTTAWAAMSAADYIDMKKLNAVADKGDFIAYVRGINGGTNGLADRLRIFDLARKALGLA